MFDQEFLIITYRLLILGCLPTVTYSTAYTRILYGRIVFVGIFETKTFV